MTAKILLQARKQQSELQDEYGIGQDLDDQDTNNNSNKLTRNLGPRGDGKQQISFDIADNNNEEDLNNNNNNNNNSNFLSRPFKKFQTNFKLQQKIRKSDHDDSDSDSDTDEQLDNNENKRDFSDEEIVII